MERGAWQATLHGVTKSWTQLSTSPVATAEFSKCAGILSAALSQHDLLGFEIAQLDSITSTSFVHSDAS